MSEISPSSFSPSSTVTFSPDLPHILQAQIGQALREMDLLHRVPKRIQANVVNNAKRREDGSFDPSSATIAVSRYADDPLLTFIHEYAHFLDNRVLHSLRREYASRYDSDFDPLLETCHRSRAVYDLSRILKKHRRLLSPVQIAFLTESQEPQELFARAYTQWVCSKSLNFQLQFSLKRRIAARMPFVREFARIQWDPEDFADIMGELEILLRKKGLL